jgi:hypothetical protein
MKEPEFVGKGKKRAATNGSDEPRTRRRVSQADEGDQSSGGSKSRASKTTDEPTVVASRSKSGKSRATGVTRFWRTNSSIAAQSAEAPSKKKDFMSSGMYCQDPDPNSPRKLVNRVLSRRHAELKAARKKGRSNETESAEGEGSRDVFPPMPYDYGEELFFQQEHEFALPYDIHWAAENGSLDLQKRPEAYQRIRQSESEQRQTLI